jgi:hypothetical protein
MDIDSIDDIRPDRPLAGHPPVLSAEASHQSPEII